VALVGLAFIPWYIRIMGPEAYGLVGFFAMLQAVFMMLDMGLSPTIVRETARFQGGTSTANDYRSLVRALESIFFGVALLGGIALFFASESIATYWLQSESLSSESISLSLEIISVLVALRWVCGLYRGVISGSQKLVWLGAFNSIIASLRFVVVIPWLIYAGATPEYFFAFQLGVAIIEFSGLMIYAYLLLPYLGPNITIIWEWSALKPVLKFALTIAFTTTVWVMVTQVDKLILSGLLPLSEYGYYSLVVLFAAGVTLLCSPISAALIPYMTKLEAENKHTEMIDVYRLATQFISVLAGSATVFIFFFSIDIVEVWSSDTVMAEKVGPLLAIYVIGNGLLAVAAFPSYLQFAKGDLHLHLLGNIIFVVLFIPSVYWATVTYGAIGAAFSWASINCLSFVAWLPLVHKKFAPGLNLKWYCIDIGIIVAPMILMGIFIRNITELSGGRAGNFAALLLIAVCLFLTGCSASSVARKNALIHLSRIVGTYRL